LVWTPWLPFGLPSRVSIATDVAAVSGRWPRVYIADRGRVFYRTKVATDAFADYGPWQGLKPNAALRLAAARVGDSTHMLATVDEQGVVSIATQTGDNAPFSEWSQLPALGVEVVNLELVVREGTTLVYALDSSGDVWQRVYAAAGATWNLLVDSGGPIYMDAITSSPEGGVFGINWIGYVYQLDEQQKAWNLVANNMGG